MAEPIRVLVVDDSVVIRKAVTDALSGDAEILVVGAASNGKIALQRIPQLSPDVLVLDIEMPDLDGFGVLKALRRDCPRLRTIMFSTRTHHGAVQTIEALSLGASDYVSKPESSATTGYADVVKRVASELIPKIKQFRPMRLQTGAVLEGRAVIPVPWGGGFKKSHVRPGIVAIGISTGGPEALAKLIPSLPDGFPVPVVIVQHMPPVFTKLLSDRLALSSKIKVFEGAEGMAVEPGAAYIAPGDYHMTVRGNGEAVNICLGQEPPENSCRPAADVLFRSVAQIYGSRVLGVVMTGMGQDGLRGAREMKRLGAAILAQDQASSVVWGMPSFIVREGLADEVVPLDRMGRAIEQRVAGGGTA